VSRVAPAQLRTALWVLPDSSAYLYPPLPQQETQMMRRLLPALSALVLSPDALPTRRRRNPQPRPPPRRTAALQQGWSTSSNARYFSTAAGPVARRSCWKPTHRRPAHLGERHADRAEGHPRVRHDRANIGNSEPAPTPRTAADVVQDLHALLAAAARSRPICSPGLLRRADSATVRAGYPDDVAGLCWLSRTTPTRSNSSRRT
jgi:hypothetical protein